MIDKEIIELQKGCKGSCCVILNDDINKLESKALISAGCTRKELEEMLKQEKEYFVIAGIDEITIDMQEIYYQIVKDRQYNGKELSKDAVIVFTIKDKESLKNIMYELYNLCVVAF